jgi:hypothetical protein
MAAMSDFMETTVLEHFLDGTAYGSPASVWVAIHNTDPTDADSGTEVTGGAYARVQMTGGFTVSGDNATNTAAVTFPTATDATWGTANYFGIYDAVSGSELLIHGALTDPKTIGDGDTFEFAIGNLSITMA